jgi:4-amino-4-deoxy-L-arabinose transferase-like glycosyltransferase
LPRLGTDRAAAFWIILLSSTLWKVILAGKLDICYDEGHYFFWSLFPQLSYFDHPPLTAWAMALIHPVFGDSIWTVRFWPLLVGVLFPLAGRQMGRQIFDDAVGNRAGIFLTLCPVFFGNGFLMTPDTFMAMFWALALWATWQALRQASFRFRWWLAAGMLVGMGLLSKYTMVLYFLGLGALLLLMPGKRKNVFWGALLSGTSSTTGFLSSIS